LDNISVRDLRAEDADDIARIYSEIIQAPVESDFKQLIVEHAQRKNDACFVAVMEDGKIAGFMISYILTMGFGITKSAWMATFGVDPAHMGRGIGKKLADEVLKYYRAEGIKNVYSSVRWDSPDLLSFFKSLGFDRSNFINLRKVLD
jgi:ribosomal protein S18 acetylase RimI-like enzyme